MELWDQRKTVTIFPGKSGIYSGVSDPGTVGRRLVDNTLPCLNTHPLNPAVAPRAGHQAVSTVYISFTKTVFRQCAGPYAPCSCREEKLIFLRLRRWGKLRSTCFSKHKTDQDLQQILQCRFYIVCRICLVHIRFDPQGICAGSC